MEKKLGGTKQQVGPKQDFFLQDIKWNAKQQSWRETLHRLSSSKNLKLLTLLLTVSQQTNKHGASSCKLKFYTEKEVFEGKCFFEKKKTEGKLIIHADTTI